VRSITIILTIFAAIHTSCSTDTTVRLFRNVNLENMGIHLKLNNVPKGLHDEPFVIKFSNILYNFSDGAVDVTAYNAFTVGNREKTSPQSIESVSNFLDPFSKFKDTWFGVYILIDDLRGKGKKFILNKPDGSPDEEINLNVQSLLTLTAIDQKLITWSTHQNQKDYGWNDFEREFYFHIRKGTGIKQESVSDRRGRKWYKYSGEYETIAALTDIEKTDMSLFSSIRAYMGLPDTEVYKSVNPWHPLVIKGSICVRYFNCSNVKFWAVVYYNGSAFKNKNGMQIDTWLNTDLQHVLSTMFESLEIDCVSR